MNRLRNSALSAAALASLLLLPTGCESDNDEPLAYESREIRGDARKDIPAGAALMKEGHEPLHFQAPNDGTVWVYNSSDNRLVYSGSIRSGQTVQVDADHDFVTVDGRKVVDMKMDDFDNHQILFGPSTLTAAPAPAQPARPAAGTITVQPADPAPVTIQQEPAKVHVKPGEVQVEPSRVKVAPADR